MPMTTLSSHELDQDPRRARKAAQDGPVFITDSGGKPAYALLTFEDYRRLASDEHKIADLLVMPEVDDLALERPWPRDLARLANVS